MALDVFSPNGDDGGWPSGDFNDVIDSGGGFMSTTVDNDVVVFDTESLSGPGGRITDRDICRSVTLFARARDLGVGGNNRLAIDIDVGGGGLGETLASDDLTTSFLIYVFVNVLWDNIDYTETQLGNLQMIVRANQSGMPTSATWELDWLFMGVFFSPHGTPVLQMGQYQPT